MIRDVAPLSIGQGGTTVPSDPGGLERFACYESLPGTTCTSVAQVGQERHEQAK